MALDEVLKRFPTWDVETDKAHLAPDVDRPRVGDASRSPRRDRRPGAGVTAAPTRCRARPSGRPDRRPYDATLRREQSAATRERIVTAGCELLHAGSIRGLEAADRPGGGRPGRGQRADRLPALRERARSDRCRHAPARAGGRHRPRGDGAGRHRHGGHPDPRPRGVVPDRSRGPRWTPPWSMPTGARRMRSSAPWPPPPGRGPRTAGSWPRRCFDVLWSVEAFERLVGDWRVEPGRGRPRAGLGDRARRPGGARRSGARVADRRGRRRRRQCRAPASAATWAARNAGRPGPWPPGRTRGMPRAPRRRRSSTPAASSRSA